MSARDVIHETYNVLAAARDFSPNNPKMTSTLTSFVNYVFQHQGSAELLEIIAMDQRMREDLPMLCARAECEMEKFWAQLLVSGNKKLQDFWYIDCYRALVETEVRLLQQNADQAKEIVFLGSGALPMTAFLMADYFPQAKIICMDRDAEACALSRQLAVVLGYADRVSIIEADAADFIPQPDQVVVMASLLQGKAGLYQRCAKAGVQVLVRDAEDVFQLLYKRSELPGTEYAEVAKTTPGKGCVNTTRLFAVR